MLRSWYFILISFCKKSVFSILFLLSFAFGTICGNLFIRASVRPEAEWIISYCEVINHSLTFDFFVLLFHSSIPFLMAAIVGVARLPLPVLFFVVGMRGCFLTYYFAICYLSGVSTFWYCIRSTILVSLFYILCREIWIRSNRHNDRYIF